MKALLITHIWLWYLLGDDGLSRSHRNIIDDETVDLSLSSISIREAHLLIEKQRLPVNEAPGVWIWSALQSPQLREAGITFAIALRSRSLALSHQDPADRFIGAPPLN